MYPVEQVDTLQADEEAHVAAEVQSYLRALARGANDKTQRGQRHRELLEYLGAAGDGPG